MAAKTLILFTLLTIICSTTVVSDNTPPSAHDILQKFGLPTGLLPNFVFSHSLSDDGSFVVELDKYCYIHFEYLVHYDTKITWKLKFGSITDLVGIKVQSFFWFDVNEIRVDLPTSDYIYFTVGIINKKLYIDQFHKIHDCIDNDLTSCDQSSNPISHSHSQPQISTL